MPIGQRMMKGGQLYLDECGPIEGGGSIGDGSGSGQSEADGRVKQAETGTGRTRLSDSSLGSDSSYGSNSNSSGSSSTQGRGSHSSQSLEEMADSLASLRPAFHQIPSQGGPTMSHHSNCPMGQKHPSAVGTLSGPSIPAALAGTSIAPVLPRYRRNTGGGGRPLRQQQSMPEPSPSSSSRHLPHQQSSITSATAAGIADFGEDGTDRHRLAAPSRPRRKISEPPPSSAYPQFVSSQPQQRRKNSIRNVFSKMSTPSIMIGADPADLLALQHLIPPTDERLLNRRQSSQEQINQQQQQKQEEERWMNE